MHDDTLDAINTELERTVASADLPTPLADAIRYSLLGGGKRLRPMLSWHSAVAIGGEGPESLPAGCAVELVHAFSLVHDDLPAMDDDDMRRGKPTLHVHAGEAMAVLAGDAMLTLAFGALDAVEDANVRTHLVGELVRGTTGMIAGQVYDTLGGFDPGLSDDDKLRLVHRNKTGALIVAACRMGGRLGSRLARTDDATLDRLETYAAALGLQFQVIDDVLDVTASPDDLGKATGKDADAGKLTFPGLYGVDRSRDIAAQLHDQALDALAPFGPAADGLRALAERMRVRTA